MIEFYIGKVRFNIEFSFLAVIALLGVLDNGRNFIYGLWVCIIHEVGHIIPMFLLERLGQLDFMLRNKYFSTEKYNQTCLSGYNHNFRWSDTQYSLGSNVLYQ